MEQLVEFAQVGLDVARRQGNAGSASSGKTTVSPAPSTPWSNNGAMPYADLDLLG